MGVARKLNGTLRDFMEGCELFFVGTAAPEGRVNISPKGLDTLRIMSDTRVVWLNLSGSGNETAAHLREANRMTMMFCAFNGEARILRLYGRSKVLHPRDDEFAELAAMFKEMAGTRQIFDMEIDMVQTSCGSGVPIMTFERQRGEEELVPYYAAMGQDGVEAYWRRKNTLSVDGKSTGILP